MKDRQPKQGMQPAYSNDRGRNISEARGGIGVIAGPFIMRGGPISDIHAITGYSEHSLWQLTYYLRTRDPEIKIPTHEAINKARSLAHTGKPKISHGREYSPGQLRSFAFVKSLSDAGFITRDLTYWKKLHHLYASYKRKLPDDFSFQVRLETFLKAQEQEKSGDREMTDRYFSLGESIDVELVEGEVVRKEHRFILHPKSEENTPVAVRKMLVEEEGGVVRVVSISIYP